MKLLLLLVAALATGIGALAAAAAGLFLGFQGTAAQADYASPALLGLAAVLALLSAILFVRAITGSMRALKKRGVEVREAAE
jgi:uncharacterized membrane-anchored protein